MNDEKRQPTQVVLQLNMIDDLVEKLNLTNVIATLKPILAKFTQWVLSSKYVNTESLGQVHLQSFGAGMGTTMMFVFLYPYISKYLDQWFGMFGTLFRHLALWGFVALVLSYVMSPNRASGHRPHPRQRQHSYTELEYSVKSSNPTTRPTSPSKQLRKPIYRRETEPNIGRRGSGFTDAQMLISMTEQQQFMERAKYERDSKTPKDGYEKFMDGAIREEDKREKYNNFIDGAARVEEERDKYKKFVGANKDQILKKRVA